MPYDRLFSPCSLGRLRLRNRIAVLPYGTAMVQDGVPRADHLAHMTNIAKSGPALMFTGATVVHPSTATRNRILVEAFNEAALPPLAALAEAVHAHDVKLFGQLLHLGREWPVADSDFAQMAPSPVRSPRDAYAPREMDAGDIAMVVEAFGRSAHNLQRAGYDGIDIHGAHGYLVAQFLSPATNHRSDAWGGTPEKRLRFLFEVIDSIRAHCGADMPLSLRLSADEEIDGGLEIRDTVAIAQAVERHGGVDLLSITLGNRGAYVKDMTAPDAPAAQAAQAFRRGCGLPLLVGQRISTPAVAERVLAEGAADLVGMVRAFFADPDWIPKAAADQAERIRPCLNFNQDCRAFSPHLHCGVNPVVGRESLPAFRELVPARPAKRIAVIGGGPGGLEAALTAALRGHDVTVYEASSGFGGQFLYAASVPHRDRLRRLIDWQLAELRRIGIALHSDTRVTRAADITGGCDAAIVATGARARPLEESLRAAGGVRWFDILEHGAPEPHGAGRALFVDDGTGFWWNYGVAEALVAAGWQLTYATPSTAVAHMIPHESVAPLLARLGSGRTEFRVLTALDTIVDGGARLTNLISGEDAVLPCELVVIQTGREPVTAGVAALRADGIPAVHAIGDCVTPRRASIALYEAQQLARTI